MASITNTRAHLISGPPIPGHKPPQWLPGKNRLDAGYWSTAERHNSVKRWIDMGWLSVDMSEELPDPTIPPSDAELAKFTEQELKVALKERNVPVQWHPALEAELERRHGAKKEKVAAKLPKPAPPERKSLTGIRVEDALPMIAAESDIDTLEAWDDSDRRKSIAEAIEERLEELAGDED